MNYDQKETGLRIRTLREEYAYTREQLSEHANLSVQFIADIESGRKSMKAASLCKLANAFHVSTDYLLFGRPYSPASQMEILLEPLTEDQRTCIEGMVAYYVRCMTKNNAANDFEDDMEENP